MATTYTDPVTILRDYIRLLVKDNVQGQMVLTDLDIQALMLSYPAAIIPSRDAYGIAYQAAVTLYAHWARQASAQVGPLRIEADKRAAACLLLAKIMYNQFKGLPIDGSVSSLVLFSGAMTLDVADRPAPIFTRSMPL